MKDHLSSISMGRFVKNRLNDFNNSHSYSIKINDIELVPFLDLQDYSECVQEQVQYLKKIQMLKPCIYSAAVRG